MLIHHNDMSSGLQKYVSIWTYFCLFLPQCNNLEMVSILSKWVNTDLIELENQRGFF